MNRMADLVIVTFKKPWIGHQKYKVSQAVHYPARNLKVTTYRYYIPLSMVYEAVKDGGEVQEE